MHVLSIILVKFCPACSSVLSRHKCCPILSRIILKTQFGELLVSKCFEHFVLFSLSSPRACRRIYNPVLRHSGHLQTVLINSFKTLINYLGLVFTGLHGPVKEKVKKKY